MTINDSLFSQDSDTSAAVNDLWIRAGSALTPSPLLATQAGKLPVPLQAAARSVQAKFVQESFDRLATAQVRAAASGRGEPRASLIMHSANMEAFSKCSILEYFPWHLVKPNELHDLAQEIEQTQNLSRMEILYRRLKAANVFIAAQPKDDRESYMRGVSAILKSFPVHSLLLDAEQIHLSSPSQFEAVAQELGVSPFFIASCGRNEARFHSAMSVETGRPAIFCDSAGTKLGQTDPATRSTVKRPASAPSAMAAPSSFAGTAASSGRSSQCDALPNRLQQIRARQAQARRPTSPSPG